MSEARVIIVGGGPAGASSAFFLARAGVDVLILDRARFPRDKTCSEYLSPQASRILAEMNALENIERSGAAKLAGMRVHAPNGATIHGEFAASHGFQGYSDRGLAVRRTILDAILLNRARDAGARVEEESRVTDILRAPDGSVKGVVSMDHDGKKTQRLSDIVIGADGLHSVVGRRLGLVRASRWPRRLALVTHFTGVHGVGAFGEMHVDRGGYCGLANVGNNVTNVAIVVPVSRSSEVAAGRTEFLERWIADRPKLAEMFSGSTRIDPVRATGPFAMSAKRAWAPGAALVGDAAEFFDPFTGEGIYTALRGGELLAGFLAEGTSPDILRAYETARRAEFSGKWMVERLVGTAVAFPALINRAAQVLARRRDMADLLVGVVGDFVPASEVLRPRYLLNLLFTPTGSA